MSVPLQQKEEISEVKGELTKKLAKRPPRQRLVNLNILKAFDTDPGLQLVMNNLLKQRLQKLLSQKIANRQSVDSLIRSNILPSNNSTNEQDPNKESIFRRYSKDLTEFLARRPSLDELVKANMVEDVMTWTLLVSKGTIPHPRNCHTTSLMDNDKVIYLIGGFGTGSTSIDLLALNIETRTWYRPLVGGVVPIERYSHSCVTVGNHLLVFGGFSVNGKWLNNLHALDTEYKQEFVPSLSAYGAKKAQQSPMLLWYEPETTGDPPCPRAAHSACVINNQMFIFGGNNNNQLFNDLHVLDTQTMKWSEPPTQGNKPCPRAGHTMTVIGKYLVVFGGSDGKKALNDIYMLDTETLTWNKPEIHGTPPSPRAGHSACLVRKHHLLIFAGGYPLKILNDLHMFDTETMTWSRPSDIGDVPSPRAGHSCCVSKNNVVYIYGGGDAEKELFNELYALDTGYFTTDNSEISKLIYASRPTQNSGSVSPITSDTVTTPESKQENENQNISNNHEGNDRNSDDSSTIMDVNLLSNELSMMSNEVETMVTNLKANVDRRISEFRTREQSYLAILKSIDCERNQLVSDITKEVENLQTQVKSRLNDFQQHFVLNSLAHLSNITDQVQNENNNNINNINNNNNTTLPTITRVPPKKPSSAKILERIDEESELSLTNDNNIISNSNQNIDNNNDKGENYNNIDNNDHKNNNSISNINNHENLSNGEKMLKINKPKNFQKSLNATAKNFVPSSVPLSIQAQAAAQAAKEFQSNQTAQLQYQQYYQQYYQVAQTAAAIANNLHNNAISFPHLVNVSPSISTNLNTMNAINNLSTLNTMSPYVNLIDPSYFNPFNTSTNFFTASNSPNNNNTNINGMNTRNTIQMNNQNNNNNANSLNLSKKKKKKKKPKKQFSNTLNNINPNNNINNNFGLNNNLNINNGANSNDNNNLTNIKKGGDHTD